MVKYFYIFLLILLEISFSVQNVLNDTGPLDLKGSSRVLSRRKRYLIFPDGSSFQLVFCTQTHGYLQVGDIVWFGSTAALAWELPTDPKFFKFFKKHDKLHTAENRNGVSKLIYFLDENGKVLSKMPYRKKMIVNPAFAKRSVDDNENIKEKLQAISIQELHENRQKLSIFDSLEKHEVEFHRQGRRGLYVQLEKFIQALGWSGRECVLRLLCEHGRVITGQSTFLGEIIRATFTLPKGEDFETDIHKEYDRAHRAKDCVDLYPQCKESEY